MDERMKAQPRRPRAATRRILASLLAGALAFASAGAAADHERSRSAKPGGASDADAAVAEVRERTGGRVLDVRPVERDGRPAWRVKVLLPGGHVRVYFVDAQRR